MNESSEAVVRWDVKATAEDIKEPVVKPLEKKTPTGFLPKTGEKATTLLTMLAILSVLLTLVVYQKIYLEKNTN
ncbi:MAG: LPXTG cell wall anchor domain-containing protein [Vagococcus sp.]